MIEETKGAIFMVDNKQIAKNIYNLMKARKLSMKRLSELTGFSYITVSRHMANGGSAIDFKITTLGIYADAFNCRITDLLKESYTKEEVPEAEGYIFSTYPYNLALDVMLYEKTKEIKKDGYSVTELVDMMRKVYIPNLLSCVELCLTEREKTIIKHRYENGETYDESAEIFHVTRERIRQIICKALEKITSPSVFNKLMVVSLEEYKSIEAQLSTEKIVYKFNIRDASIDEIGLSVRETNCLKRANVKTIKDLLNKDMDDLLQIRNLGKRSAASIQRKLLSFLAK